MRGSLYTSWSSYTMLRGNVPLTVKMYARKGQFSDSGERGQRQSHAHKHEQQRGDIRSFKIQSSSLCVHSPGEHIAYGGLTSKL